jgi:hypothetical protein
MERSRLSRIQGKRAARQGVLLIILTIAIGIVMLFWGIPAIASLAGLFIKSDTTKPIDYELKPTPPIFADIPEATYSATITVGGFAQPGIDVILFVNGAEYGRHLTTDSGTFSFENVKLGEGENTVYAYATTKGNLDSEQSKSYQVTVDTTKPTITLTSPTDGSVMRGQSQRIVTFAGKVSEEGSKVYIGERMVIVQTDGTFTLPYQLVEGDQEIALKVIDHAGNESDSSMKLRWEP